MNTLGSAHQIQVFTSFTQKEALHPVLLLFTDDIVQSCIATPIN